MVASRWGLAVLLLVLTSSAAEAESARARRLASIDRVIEIVSEKVADRRADFETTIRRVHRLLRQQKHRSWIDPDAVSSRTWRRAWLRRIVAIKKIELSSLESELATVRQNRRLELRPSPELRVGAIRRPVPGAVVASFGHYRHESGARLTRRGIELETSSGQTIQAPVAGVVDYVGEIRGIGNSIIVSGLGRERVILGPLDTRIAPGARLQEGAVVGKASGRRLYLELRVGSGAGQVVNPEKHFR